MRSLRLPALVVSLCLVLTGCGLFGDSGPKNTVDAYVKAWTSGDDAGAAARTDAPATAQPVLAGVRGSLAPKGLTADVGQVRTADKTASAAVTVHWDLGNGRTWTYPVTLDMVPAQASSTGWAIRWTPAVVNPDLQPGQTLAVLTTTPDPAPIVDRNGVPLMAATQVVSILLDRKAAGDLAAVAGTLGQALGRIDPQITAQSITAGATATPDGQAYTVAALRATDYQTVRAAIHDLPGVTFSTSSRLLAPDATFASQVLPPVRTLVAPKVDGTPGWSVATVDGSGATQKTLTAQPPVPGTTIQLGLDRTVQSAAEDAVNTLPNQTAIVAIQPSTGDILATAQNAAADQAGAIAFTGRYPPGSTFKIVTATAALENLGVNPRTPEACPGVTNLGGLVVPNENRFDLGTVPLTTAFAQSCNTTFATLASQLPADALPTAGLQLGFGADYTVPGLTTVTGNVPAAPDLVQRSADGFGQGQVVATPFGMALVTATVARGAPVTPQLIRGEQTTVTAAPTTPDAAVLDQLRPMMREVVLSGTATGLRGSGEVYGKTGTAEFAVNGTNRAHGWFVGYRGDLAFAVLIVDGGSSAPAVQIAQKFLAAVPG